MTSPADDVIKLYTVASLTLPPLSTLPLCCIILASYCQQVTLGGHPSGRGDLSNDSVSHISFKVGKTKQKRDPAACLHNISFFLLFVTFYTSQFTQAPFPPFGRLFTFFCFFFFHFWPTIISHTSIPTQPFFHSRFLFFEQFCMVPAVTQRAHTKGYV